MEIILKIFLIMTLILSKMTYEILNGCNENEVHNCPKKYKKIGFFRKIFQPFS